LSQGPVLKGILNALASSEDLGLVESFWLKNISPAVSRSSSFKTTLGFCLLKLIIPLWTDKTTIASLLTPGLAEVSISLLSRLESTVAEDAVIISAFDSLVESAKDNPKAQNQLLKTFLEANVAFDKVSGSGIIQRLLVQSDLSAVKMAGGMYRQALLGKFVFI
jgi:hypothetical protein